MNNECAIEELVEVLKIARNHFPADIDISEDEASDLAKIDALLARLAETKAEFARLGRELNRAKYGEPYFALDAQQAALDAAQAEIEHLHLLLAEKALDEMVQAGEADGLLNEK